VKRLRKLPLRIWAIPPLTLIFGAVVFRLTWDIPYFTATISKVLLSLSIAGVVAGYFFILRFLIRPGSAKNLKPRAMRAGAIAGVGVGVAAATAYLVQQVPVSIAPISKVVLGLAIGVAASGYFFLLLLIRPGLIEKLKTRPVRIGVTAVVTAALAALTIHTIRFLPSPEAAHPFSQIMAILLLAALISVYPLILKYIWRVWRRGRVD